MSELPTIAIVSPKDPAERWIINLRDFDPAKHVRWEDRSEQIVPFTAAQDNSVGVDEAVRGPGRPRKAR